MPPLVKYFPKGTILLCPIFIIGSDLLSHYSSASHRVNKSNTINQSDGESLNSSQHILESDLYHKNILHTINEFIVK